MTIKRIIYRLVFLVLTILIIPLLPIAIIFLGISNPEYVIYGTLNLDVSHRASAWEIYTTFLRHIILFDFGTSTASGQLVIKEIESALRESAKSIIPALCFSYGLGTFIGVFIIKSQRAENLWRKSAFIFYVPMIVFSYVFLYLLDRMGIDFLSSIKYLFTSLILSIYPIHIVSKSFSKTIFETTKSDFFLFINPVDSIRNRYGKSFVKNLFLLIIYHSLKTLSFTCSDSFSL